LHGALDDLQNRNSDIVHSLTNQLTYVKKVADTASLNTESIANLSSIVKDSTIQSHDKYQQFTRDLLLLNFTFLGQSTIYTAVRQMEFTLLQLTQQLDEIFDAIQLAISGNLSMKLISPSSLQSILRNITLHLPEGYELIASTRIEDIHQYYKLSKVSIVANSHSLKLVLRILLKSADYSFTLYKIITLPKEYLQTNLFSMQLIIHIWRYKSVNPAINLLPRETTVDAFQIASLYARWIR